MTNLLWLGAFPAAGLAYLFIAQKWPFQPRSAPHMSVLGKNRSGSAPASRLDKVAFGKR